MKYYTKTLNNCEELIERFDFEKVHALMVTSHWTYCGEDESPTVGRIKSMAHSLAYTLAENSRANCRVASGGFIFTRFEWDGSWDYQLVFAWENKSQTESKEVV